MDEALSAWVGPAEEAVRRQRDAVKAAREPLSYAGINSIGLRRRGFSNETILNIEDIYRIIYVRSNNITQALNAVELEVAACEEKRNIIRFIRESTKGIIRGPSLS